MSAPLFSESLFISKFKFNKDSIKSIEDNLWVKNLWPLVYIISDENLKEAYVGESANAISRITNHLSNPERNKLSNLHLITCDKFNKSATLDIESNLIKYISADGKFNLQNGNIGLALHNFYQKEQYYKIFSLIWSELKKEDIALQNLKEIDNSDLFKYSPYKALTNDQYNSVKEIIDILVTNRTNSIFVDGSAGTGKTIVAVFLMKLLNTDFDTLFDIEDSDTGDTRNLISSLKRKYPKPKVALVVPMTSLRKTLKMVFKNVKGLSANMVIGPSEVTKEKYDILLVDEAHRLRRRLNITNYKSFDENNKLLGLDNNGTELDWILMQSVNQIFFYDAAQSIKPSDIPKEIFDDLFKRSVKIKLQSQLRVKGGNDYITYVDKLLNTSLSTKQTVFSSKDYEFSLFDSLDSLITKLKEKENELGLCRLVAGFSWAWVSKEENTHDIEIEGLKLTWNKENIEWINSNNAINEVGCIHTTQGYDLNYTGIIFGREISYDFATDQIIIKPENYYDSKGKNGIKDAAVLKAYIINIYKTLMYRGIRGTYVYACDENLRRYFKKHISIFEQELPFRILARDEINPFINCVPLYDISVAAGSFSELQQQSDFEWVELPKPYKVGEDYFVCKVVGESMNKIIPNGSWCLFKKDTGGSREGKIVLVEHYDIQDSDFGAGYTIKSYHSEKEIGNDSWSHNVIVLKTMSVTSNYEDITLHEGQVDKLHVVGIFVGVLK